MSMTCKNNLVGYLFSLWFLFHIKYCQLGPKCVPDARWFYEVIPLGSLGWVGLDVSWLRLLERFLSLMVTGASWGAQQLAGVPGTLAGSTWQGNAVRAPVSSAGPLVCSFPSKGQVFNHYEYSIICLPGEAMWMPCHPAVHTAFHVCGDIFKHRAGAFVFQLGLYHPWWTQNVALFGIGIEAQIPYPVRIRTMGGRGKERKRRKRKKRKLYLNGNVFFWRRKYVHRFSVL